MQTILHIDMDAFFAAVEVNDHPEWAGKPLVVGSPPDKRGVVSTASYEARKFGVHSAMPSRTAYKLCPHAIFVPVRMRRYLEVSEQIMEIIHDFSPDIEQISVDEAFVDIKGVLRNWKSPHALALELKSRIRNETGLSASVGLAPNKFLAKLASDHEKPDGLTIVPEKPDAIRTFLAPLPVKCIWGVGKVTEKKLNSSGFYQIGDLQKVSADALSPVLGPAMASHISSLARGEDSRPVVTQSQAKSISSENTFTEDVSDKEVVRREMVNLVEQVGQRLRKNHDAAKTVFIKLRYEDFQTVTRQESFDEAVCSDQRLLFEAIRLLEREHIRQPVRLVGFGVSGLCDSRTPAPQMELFPSESSGKESKAIQLDRAVDHIKQTLGPDAIRRASGISTDSGD